MDKRTKNGLIAAAFHVAIGVIMFAAAMTAYHWDFSRLSTGQPETNAYVIEDDFSNIQLNTETADILFSVSDDDTCTVVCCEQKNLKHAVGVQGDTLTVSAVDGRKWIERIGIDLRAPKVTICLPKAGYGALDITGSTGAVEIPDAFRFSYVDISMSTGSVDLSASVSGSAIVSTTTGDIRARRISAGTLDLSSSTGGIVVSDVNCRDDIKVKVTTGEAELANVTCRDLLSDGSTGSVTLKNVNAAGKISIGRTTGNVTFNGSDAAEILVKTSTGDVSGSLLTEKVFVTETSTGRISVPRTTSGGLCEITTSTGDIRIRAAE